MKKILSLLVFVFLTLSITAQEGTVFGKWKTIDDATGEAKSIVEIYKKDGKVYGKIADILNPADRDKICTYCKGDEHDAPLIGLDIIKGLKKEGNDYGGGTIFDPEKNKKYKAKIWVDKSDPSRLNVRGYVAFFFRTQQWVREE